MKFIDLFAGIGGFHYGIKQAIKAECVYSNEWDKHANSVYRKHFGSCDQSDIRAVTASQLPDFDLLCGGFPCQAFSIAGKRGGFNDTRGTLFFEIARIISAKRPKLLLLENVKGLLSHDGGRTFQTIIATIDELGYDVQWQVLNSKNFGVPQNRERVFIVGHLAGEPRPQVFPIRENDQLPEEAHEPDKRQSQAQISHTLKGSNMKADNVYGGFGESKVREFHDYSPTIRTPKGGGHIPMIVDHGTIKETQDINCIDANYWKGVDNHGQRTMIGSETTLRRLTPTECERLQGFPDDWTKYGADDQIISDTQRYKMCGNAVTTNVITEIIKRL